MEKKARLRGWALPWAVPTGPFIRDYLLEHGKGYAQEIWRALKEARLARDLGVCTYQSFRTNYMYVLRQLGLIEKVEQESVRPEWYRRVYYRIVPGMEDAPEWKHPQSALDPRRGLGKKRYKRVKG